MSQDERSETSSEHMLGYRHGYDAAVVPEIDITNLLNVIREVHSDHADDLCWLSIDEIFIAASLPIPDRSVCDKVAMRKNCDRFIDVMCSGGNLPSYAELERKIISLEKANELYRKGMELQLTPEERKSLESDYMEFQNDLADDGSVWPEFQGDGK